MRHIVFIVALWLGTLGAPVAAQRVLTLEQTIDLATDSALEAFKNENLYLSGYWEYRSYRANRLPSVTLDLTPANYNRGFVSRYDSETDMDFYGLQRSYSASGALTIQQNLDILGGTFFVQSGLQYLRYMGDYASNQFSAVPVSIGYQQDLLGYNPFKWEKKIEPLKYEKVKKEFLYNTEQIAEQATSYFFALAMAQADYDLAVKNKLAADTLYAIGQRKFEITSITNDELYTLELEKVNAYNTLRSAELELKRAMFSLVTYLNLDPDTELRLTLPTRTHAYQLTAEEALLMARENNPTYLQTRQDILEAERDLDKTRRESMFQASFSASVGFNQAASNFRDAYRDPLRQDMVALSISIPILDWGVRKGKYRMAKNNLSVIEISSRQSEVAVEQSVVMAVNDFNLQQELILSAEYALELAESAYAKTMTRFIEGNTDMNTLTLASNRKDEANKNYISALENYWLSYYQIRRLTLYDFVKGLSISHEFDQELEAF
ncbi:MAG TPA: TolC family protein [Candidatus Parabacteroides intestinigallinarum]|uniref:TolC family protein n=1 Tax=Candidatus Parabacteroides intestinigallinarum TaxID=2838722 RepID=A0A9D1XQZ3_9BACT|nr:TolC family protein [Candidatus Parabacteroides intestinigallinarum]